MTLKDLNCYSTSALNILYFTVEELLRMNEGKKMTTSIIAEQLGIESYYEGKHNNSLTYGILGNLLKKGSVENKGPKRSPNFVLTINSNTKPIK
jgi:hypothetical protein